MKLRSLLVAFLLAAAPVRADLLDAVVIPPRTLPNECAILASEAYSRLSTAGYWVKVMCIKFTVKGDPKVYGHAITVWQLHAGGQILCFDESLFSGTLSIPTTSQNCQDIKDCLNAGAPPGFVISFATFIN